MTELVKTNQTLKGERENRRSGTQHIPSPPHVTANDTINEKLRILILEDVPNDAALVEYELRRSGILFWSDRVESREAFLRKIDDFKPDVVLADFALPQFTALDALRLLKERKLNIPFILVTGSQSEEVAVECMKAGADDYVLKMSLKRLPTALLNALAKKQAEYEKDKTNEALKAEILERRQIERSLRESEERYRVVAETASDAIVTIDEESMILYVNPAMERMFGYAGADMIGQQLTMLIPEFMSYNRRLSLKRYRDTNQKYIAWQGVLLPGLHRTGKEIPLEISFGEFVKNGQHVFTGVIRDITERVRAVEYAQRLAAIVESSNDGIIGKSLDGIITSWNHGAELIYGYQEEEVLGQPISILVPADRHDEIPSILERLKQGERINDYETVRKRKDGSLIHVAVTISPIKDSESRIVGASAMTRDITQRLQTEDDLRKTRERLETLSHRLLEVQEGERRHIARELHDEIGQALTAVKINLQAMHRTVDAEARSSRVRESVEIIDHAISQVRNLCLDLRPSILDDLGIVAALRWYLDRVAHRAGFESHFIENGIESRLGSDLETTCFRITQEALTNIVRYAEARRVEVELRRNNGDLYLTIRDDGVGFNVDEAKEKAIRGGSLGILGMQERVSLSGGVLEFKSVIDYGTEVIAKFPCHTM